MQDDRRVIVVGSGPAGATAALTLLEQGIPVTLLESGDSVPRGWLVRVMGKNVYRKTPGLEPTPAHLASADPDAQWFRALVPGGMSNHWSGAVPRFAPGDFSEGERLHERYRWPVSYADVAPYYARVERLLGVVAGPRDVPNLPASVVSRTRRLPADWRRVAAHVEQAGHGLTLLPQAARPLWGVWRSGVGFNSFSSIVQRLQRFPHFRLLLGAHALRLEWDGQRRRVSSVIYHHRSSGAQRRVAGSAVVVAAGPLASTKLLLDSACADFPEGLGDTQGVLGRYLHDHPHDLGTLEVDGRLTRLGQPAYLTRAPYDSSEPLRSAAFAVGSHSRADKLLSLTPLKTGVFSMWTFGTMVPREQNQVRLDTRVKDEHGLPRLDVHIRYGEEEQRTMAEARERLRAILDSAGVRSTVRSALPKLVPGFSKHYGGTVRMHRSPRYGMLNAWSRLHAVDNVVVADASAFTTGPEKNPTLTVMALAARASHRLANDLRSA